MPRDGGRDRAKEEFWRRMVRDQARGGLTVREWCRRHRLQEAAFYWWRKQLARRDAETTLVPVRVMEDRSAEPGGRIEIVLPDQRRVQVIGRVDREALVDVLTALSCTASASSGVVGARLSPGEASPC